MSNISPSGIRLLTDKPMESSMGFLFRIELPHLIDRQRELHLSVTNVWTDDSLRGNFYESGFEFDDPSAVVTSCITALMAKYGSFPDRSLAV